jgi:hypothetical protein
MCQSPQPLICIGRVRFYCILGHNPSVQAVIEFRLRPQPDCPVISASWQLDGQYVRGLFRGSHADGLADDALTSCQKRMTSSKLAVVLKYVYSS